MTWPTTPVWIPEYTAKPKVSFVDTVLWGDRAVLRADEPWPVCAQSHPMVLVAQINRDRLPEPFRAEKCMWQIFACTECATHPEVVRAARHSPAKEWVVKDGPQAADALRVERWIECSAGDCAHPEEAELINRTVYSSEEWVKMAHLCLRGPKLGGFAVWLKPMKTFACKSCNVNLRHCMTLEADHIHWGGSSNGNLALFCCLEHPDELELLVLIPYTEFCSNEYTRD